MMNTCFTKKSNQEIKPKISIIFKLWKDFVNLSIAQIVQKLRASFQTISMNLQRKTPQYQFEVIAILDFSSSQNQNKHDENKCSHNLMSIIQKVSNHHIHHAWSN
jgi:IS30 family transposase